MATWNYCDEFSCELAMRGPPPPPAALAGLPTEERLTELTTGPPNRLCLAETPIPAGRLWECFVPPLTLFVDVGSVYLDFGEHVPTFILAKSCCEGLHARFTGFL